MKSLFTSLFVLLQISVFAQTQADSVLFAPSTDSIEVNISRQSPHPVWGKLKMLDVASGRKILLHSGIAVATFGAIELTAYELVDMPLREFTQKHRNEESQEITKFIEPLGRSKILSPAAGLLYGTGFVFKDKKMQRAGLLSLVSIQLNDFATHKLKDEFQRHRPDTTPANNLFDGGEGGRHNASFPSSHTSTAFTVATSLAIVYKDSDIIPPLAYSTAALVGLSRIHDNKHWTTDVLAGATVGFITAHASNFVLNQCEKILAKKGISLYLVPQVSTDVLGVHAGITF